MPLIDSLQYICAFEFSFSDSIYNIIFYYIETVFLLLDLVKAWMDNVIVDHNSDFKYISFSLEKWITASKVAVVTINGAISGGLSAVLLGYALKWNRSRGYLLDIPQFAAGILGGLVAITAGANVFRPWVGMVVGFFGGIIANIGKCLFMKW